MRKWIRKGFKLLFYLFAASVIYLILCRWIFPPITLTQIESLYQGHGLKRSYISWEEIPYSVKLAAIASEDQLFPVHSGFDWKALEKSLQTNHKNKRRPRGSAASTISQQTAKNVFLWQGSGWTKYLRKPFEAIYTLGIETFWGKQRILEVYLNVAEMGPGIYGIEAAAQTYFHKPASQLSQYEAAMIIASLPNPKKFTVKPVSKRVQWRAPQIQKQMSLIASHPQVKILLMGD
jgi:monofunctional biosynthetic peptidoglycan transglycosylase